MNKVTKLLAQALIIGLLMLPWASSQAEENNFEAMGFMSNKGIGSFMIADREYMIAPGAKLKSVSSSRKKFSDFRNGDMIYVRGKVVGGVYYVDIIHYDGKPDAS